MTAPEERIAYVLGAGFPKPLGAPLLADLFLPASVQNVITRYGNESKDILSYATNVQRVYAYGRSYVVPSIQPHDEIRNKGGLNLWHDAEDFLAYLDAANGKIAEGQRNEVLSTALARAIGAATQSSNSFMGTSILAAAKRLLAAEVSGFLEAPNLKSERWQPYIRWLGTLGADDALITFNYDRTIEVVSQTLKSVGKEVLPDTDQSNIKTTARRYLKLHGSVDWSVSVTPDEFQRTQISQARNHCLVGDIETYGMGYPGDAKNELVQKLSFLWQAAKECLQESATIVFIGYRFPQTDARAKQELLGAIRNNSCRRLRIHTVLGPVVDDATVRLTQLLESVCRQAGRKPWPESAPGELSYILVPHRLWSDDFLAVFDRKILTGWYN